jgi:multisubunit Na+/H+ antiporter MnhB subunit
MDFQKMTSLAVIITMAVCLLSGTAHGCPICDSATAHEVRQGLREEGMGKTIAAMVSPFIILLTGLRIYSVGLANFFRNSTDKS